MRIGFARDLATRERFVAEERANLRQATIGIVVGSVVEVTEQREALDANEQFAQPDMTSHGRLVSYSTAGAPKSGSPGLRISAFGMPAGCSRRTRSMHSSVISRWARRLAS